MTGAELSGGRAQRIAVLGAGHVGPVIAKIAIDAGFHVAIAASGNPEKIELITQFVIPGAEPRWAADAVEGADIVVLAIPLHKFTTFDPSLVAGKLVVDATNYWPAADGVLQAFQDRGSTSSEVVQRRLAKSTVVKSLNHIGYHDLEDARRLAGAPDRSAIGIASDDSAAAQVVGNIIERIGYDTVHLDRLSAGRLLEPGGPIFGALLSRPEFEYALGAKAA